MKRKHVYKSIIAIAVAMAFVMPVAAFANVGIIRVTFNSDNSAEEIVDENGIQSFESAPSLVISDESREEHVGTENNVYEGFRNGDWYTLNVGAHINEAGSFPTLDPAAWNALVESPGHCYAGTWANGLWYAIDHYTQNLITIDTSTGEATLIGNTGLGGSDITTGMAYDPSSGTMYLTSVLDDDQMVHLYTVNLNTAAVTDLGSLTPLIVAIGCSMDGTIYATSINPDSSYIIDPSGPTAIEIGSLGIDLNWAQGAAFDKNDGKFYAATYGPTSSQLYEIDLTTGAANPLIGSFPSGGQHCAFAIPYTTSPPPEKPERPEGPTRGILDVEYTYNTTTTEPDGDQVYYKWSWGDGTYSGWLGPYNSGATGTGSHSWSVLGTYNITVKAKDIPGAQSDWSDALTISIIDNEPPNIPTITGQTAGKSNVTYLYTFVTTDPDGDDVYYYVDWGDDTFEEWLGPYDSGEKASATHSWTQGTYTIKVKAKDTFDVESDWGILDITMPVNQQSAHPWFHWLLYRFPNAFPILRQILGL